MTASFFRHGSNAILAVAIAAAALAFAIGAVPFSLVGAVIGAAVFFVSEYTTHRFLFHAQPSNIPFVLKLQHKLHYDHHIDPPKIELLFLPWWFVIPTVMVYYGIFLAIVRNPAVALSLAFGSMCALFYYEWVHYVAHIPFNPVTPFGRYVKKYHLWHHFKNEHFWYGVTNPSMDFAGATYRDVESVDRSTTVREIWRGM
ncbi:MAG: sterol desaturase family protein [Candidatus Aquilonibacter sp.]